MKLNGFDGKRVRVVTSWGEVFEGICRYNGREYNECEFGVDEESLEMPFFQFYKKNIKRAEILPDGEPYGGYSGRYGLLEEAAVRDGTDGIGEVLLSDEEEHIYRILLCIKDHLALGEAGGLPPADELARLLRSVPAPRDQEAARLLSELSDILESKITGKNTSVAPK